MPACALLVALLATLWLPTAHAADNDAPFRSSAAATGSFVSGNLSQAQAMGSLNLSKSADRAGFDVLGSAFRMWIRPAPDAPFVRIGDTLAATALPFYYLGEKPFVLGFVRYERSQLRGLTGRINGGPSIGITPVRKAERLMRISLGAQVEQTWYASPDLQPDWVADAPDRLVPRAALLSNGWARIPDSRWSGRYVGGLFVNPLLPTDLRWFLDASSDLQIAGPLALRVSVNVLHDAVNPGAVLPTDLRTTAGLSWSTPPAKQDD